MLRYIYADGRRTMCKAVVIAGMCMAMIGLVILAKMSGIGNTGEFINKASMMIKLTPLLVGVPLMTTVFFDDFRSKVILAFIGSGNPRYKAIFSKYIEFSLLVILCSIVLYVGFTMIAIVMGIGINVMLLKGLLLMFTMETMKLIALGLISSMLIYTVGSGVMAIAFYGILATGFVNVVLTQILTSEAVLKRLGNVYLLLLGNALEQMQAAVFEGNGLGILEGLGIWSGYLVLPTIISIVIFNRQELDF